MRQPTVIAPFRATELGELADQIELHFFDNDGEIPADVLERAEVYVLPYSFSAAAAELMARMPRLRVVQGLSAGYEHLVAHVPDGVVLCNGRGIHDASTAELALTLVLASLRGTPEHVRAQDRGSWEPGWRPSLADSTVLILGHGSIGSAIEARLVPFEVDVVRVASRARDGVHGVDELPALLPQADVVIVIVPATDRTRGMVDAAFLAAMPDGALLVNVARGTVVDTDALLAELESGRLRAALDVTDPEPLPADHPLWHAPGVLISPHIGGVTTAFRPRAERLVRSQLTRLLSGAAPDNVVLGEWTG